MLDPRKPRDAATALAVALCAVLLLSLGGCRHNEPESVPTAARDANVLLITLDTTRADHLSCYTPGRARTPHLDALAARGVRFLHATAQVPLTLPSHACIMTGSYPTVHRLRDMGGFVLDKSHPTIASLAQAAGFSTAAFVGSRAVAHGFGLSQGFDTYDDDMGPQTEEGKLPGMFAERRASVVTDHALTWLKQNGQRKFFLWAHYYDPHEPYDPPEPYKRQYARSPYDGEIAYMDEQVGRLLDGLDQMGLASRTLIIAMADHGESLGEHGEAAHGIFLYDATLHVPLLIAGPDVPAGQSDRRPGAVDRHPSHGDGIPAPGGIAGSTGSQPLAPPSSGNARALGLLLRRDALPTHLHGVVGIACHADGRLEIHPGAAP